MRFTPSLRESFYGPADPQDEIRQLRAALDRYRYAVAWVSADSWDHCNECRARLEWARASDDGARLDDKRMAAVSGAFLHSQ